jgi:signal transduction histidine kinase
MNANKLEEANAQLRDLNQLKTQFLSNVSHELRTPLTSIQGSADNLLDGIVGELSPPQREYVDLIRASTHRLMPFVDDLLDLSRMENGRLVLALQSFQVGQVLEGTIKSLQPLASERQVTLHLEPAPGGLIVRADSDRLSQVVTNLVENALKFTPAGGRVTITAARADPESIRISVTDNGPGIPEAEQQRIFEKFYQVQGKPQPGRGGAGLGLSIARGIVEAHGGAIGVESKPGHGSTFWFTLPLAGNSEATGGQHRS